MIFRKKKSWYGRTLRALLFAGFLYRCARMFMKLAEKQSGVKKQKVKKVKKK